MLLADEVAKDDVANVVEALVRMTIGLFGHAYGSVMVATVEFAGGDVPDVTSIHPATEVPVIVTDPLPPAPFETAAVGALPVVWRNDTLVVARVVVPFTPSIEAGVLDPIPT